jgi:uncharacterized protein (UPF0147 family)
VILAHIVQDAAAAKAAEVKKAAQEAADKLAAENNAADLKKAQEKAQVCACLYLLYL